MAWLRLRESCRASCVERDVALDLLHGLVNVSIQNRDRAESLQIRESLFAVVCAPAPLRINRPERDVRKYDDGSAALQFGNVFLEPFELLVAETTEPASLEVEYVHQADEMRPLRVEAVPAVALCVLSEALMEHFAVIVEHIVLAWNVKDAVGL